MIEGTKSKTGVLYIVGTPIGNLGDITLRAIDTLKNVDIILAEDTRQTLKLLNHLGITKHQISYHRHNEEQKIAQAIELLNDGKNIALVSDAGMPRISDPGEALIKYLVENEYKVEIIPGVTALTTAVAMCGYNADRFTFEGFLPMNNTRRKERLEELKKETRLMVFYEAPHKILYTLKDMLKYFGDRKICIARELTKLHEECIHTNITDAIQNIEGNGIKGEIVLLVCGVDKCELVSEDENTNLSNVDLVNKYINQGLSKKDAIKKVAKERKLDKNTVYMECVNNEQ